MGHLDGSVDAEGATEGVLRSNFGYGGLGNVFIVQESRQNPRDERVVAIVQDRTLTDGEWTGQRQRKTRECEAKKLTCKYASNEICGVIT